MTKASTMRNLSKAFFLIIALMLAAGLTLASAATSGAYGGGSCATLTVMAGNGGNITVSWTTGTECHPKSHSYVVPANSSHSFDTDDIYSGTDVTLNATPASACWYFTEWGGDLSGSENPTTVDMPHWGTTTITATFTKYQYTLSTAVVGNGSITLDPSGGTYDCGTVVTVSASTEDPCWYFTGWSGDLSGSDNPTTILMDGNKTITANFTEYQYTLNVESVGNGTITVSGLDGSQTVAANGNQTFYDIPCGTDVTLEAMPSECSQFDEWTGNATGTDTSTTVTVTGNMSVYGHFTTKEYNLNVESVGNGTITVSGIPDGNQTVAANGNQTFSDIPCGTEVTLTAAPADGWQFAGWTGNVTVTGPLSGSVTMDGNQAVTANFSQITYITSAPPPTVVISVVVTPGNATVSISGTQQFTATAYYSNDSSSDVTTSATWSSGNTSVATVSADLATGVAVGNTSITATFGGKSGSAALNVTAGQVVVSVLVTPETASIALGQTQQFEAWAQYADAGSINVTATADWASGNITVATISAGNATGVGVGTTDITASLDGVTSERRLS